MTTQEITSILDTALERFMVIQDALDDLLLKLDIDNIELEENNDE